MTQFDPQAFLDLPTEEASIKRPPVAAADYISTIKDIQVRTWTSKDKVDETTGKLKAGIAYDIFHTVDIPEAERTRIGLTTPTLELKDSLMLDLNAGGMIDYSPGKNGGLRRYRDATDLNKAGVPFKARDLIGRMVKVKIGHREYPEGSGDLFEEIKGVSRVA